MFAGRVPLRRALLLIQRLPHDPQSAWRAAQLGGPEHIGWSNETYLLAEQVDAVKALIAITAHQGKKGKVKFPDPVYRPKVEKDEETKEELTLDDFDIHGLMAQMQIG